MNFHSPFDAAVHRIFFIERKVVPGIGPQQENDFFERAFVFNLWGRRWFDGRDVFKDRNELFGQLAGRSYHIGPHRIDGISGHAVKPCCFWFLHHHDPVFFFDGLDSQTAVGAHARKDNTDGKLLMVVGKRAQEKINRKAQPSCFCWFKKVKRSF